MCQTVHSNRFHVQAKNIPVLLCASVELLSVKNWTENSQVQMWI